LGLGRRLKSGRWARGGQTPEAPASENPTPRDRGRQAPAGGDDAVTRAVIARLQAGGVCWFGGTQWGGRAAMRISVASWRTGAPDVDRSVEEIRTALRAGVGG